LENADDDTIVVLSSDHGAVPLDRWVKLNNYFAQEGLLKFQIDPETGEPILDWKNSQAIYLKMDNIYIDPNGLDGEWQRASGEEYEALRNKVEQILLRLEDENGIKPVVKVVRWENTENQFRLHQDRVGDLVIANRPGYGWNEEMTEDMQVFSTPLKSGYKQAIISAGAKGMWTPFIIMGPGVKENNYLGENPIGMVDQYPTIMHLLGISVPDFVQGSIIEKALKE